ncbi:MAG: caspase family protein [Cyanobacteria bacterium P01_F01_bin.150]
MAEAILTQANDTNDRSAMVREALAVGINNYQIDNLQQLQAPAIDAERIAQKLENQGFWSVRRLPEGRRKSSRAIVSRFDDAWVTVQELEAAIEDLFYPQTERQKPDAALLYFSGHGLRKVGRRRTEGFLAASDVNPEADRWGLSLKWLRELLQDSPIAAQVVWLDCCHSGELLNFEEGNPGEQGQARDRCFIAASQDHQVAYEALNEPYSELTRELWRGLDNAEGDVTSLTLARFIDDAFRQQSQKRQHPIPQTSGSILLLPGAKQPQQETSLAQVQEDNPYQGLNAFERRTANFFFGREAVVNQLWQTLQRSAFVPVIGASGSGKSSVLRAGLLPLLEQQGWRTLPPITPWTEPLAILKQCLTEHLCKRSSQVKKVSALLDGNATMAEIIRELGLSKAKKTKKSQQIVLIVDQFEEIFTTCADEDELNRLRFIDLLTSVAAIEHSDLHVLIAMRADFMESCLSYRRLTELLKYAVFMPPLEGSDLQDAIAKPAEKKGFQLGDGLLDLLLEHFKEEPNCLPLLQFSLTQLWEKRNDSTMQLQVQAYQDMRGLSGALNSHAESIYLGENSNPKLCLSSDEERKWARRICLRLVRTGRADAKDTRQRQSKDLLLNMGKTLDDREDIEDVLNILVDGRLLVLGYEKTYELNNLESSDNRNEQKFQTKKSTAWIDLAHETLMTGWSRFAEWRQADRDLRRLRQRVEDSEKEWRDQEWRDQEQQDGYLLQGGLLAEARDQWERLEYELGQSTRKYFEISNQKEQDRITFLERTVAHLKLLIEAEEIKNFTKARPCIDVAIRVIKSIGINHDKLQGEILTPVQNNLRDVIARIREKNCLYGHESSVISIAFSPNSKMIVSGSEDGKVYLWQNLEKNVIRNALHSHSASVTDLAFSPDGKIIASAGEDAEIYLHVLDEDHTIESLSHSASVRAITFSPDGKYIASGSSDKTIRLWSLDGSSIKLIGKPFKGHAASISSIAFSPDSKKLVSGSDDQTIYLWDLDGNSICSWSLDLDGDHLDIDNPFQEKLQSVWSVNFSPCGKMIVSGSSTVCLWDLEGNRIGEPFQGHSKDVSSVDFSPNGKMIVSGSDDQTIRLWNLAGNLIGETFQGHSGHVFSVAFGPDGKSIVSGGSDKTIRLWDLQEEVFESSLQGHENAVWALAFSPNGRTIASGGYDQTIRLWDLKRQSIEETLKQHSEPIWSLAFSPDGNTIASGSDDKTIRLWNLRGNQIGKPFHGHSKSVQSVAFSPDGNTIASGSYDRTIRLWDREGNQIGKPFQGHSHPVQAVTFSPDGKIIASGSYDQTIRLWDREGNQISKPFNPVSGQNNPIPIWSITFSPDGKNIATGNADKTVQLWDMDGNLLKTFQGHNGSVFCVAFNPDGRTIASGSDDQTIRLWDLDGNPIGEPLKGHSDAVRAVVFSPDGKTIVSGSSDKNIRLWRGNWQSWLKVCCDRLRYHPVFKDPPDEVAREACEVCWRLVWEKEI